MDKPTKAEQYVRDRCHRDARRLLIRFRNEGLSLDNDRDIEEMTDRVAAFWDTKRIPRA